MEKKKPIAETVSKNPGSLTKAADSAGMSLSDFCSQKHSGKMAARCALFQTLSKLAPKTKKK